MGIAKATTPIILNYVWKIVTWKDGKMLNGKTRMVKMKHETKMKKKKKIWKGRTYKFRQLVVATLLIYGRALDASYAAGLEGCTK
jgi:hypothetical protein